MVRVRPARIAAAFLLLSSLALSACGEKEEPKFKEQSVELLYNAAVDQMEKEDWRNAAKVLDEVERQHPYSVWATKAQVMQAYVKYEDNKYDDAIDAADRFISLHPGNRDVAYAYYIKGISYYEQIVDVGRDQKNTENALKALQDVATRFPDSKYARDARLKIDLTRDHLAGKQMEIGRYYEAAGLYVAAINRFRSVVKEYQTTTHVPEALARLTECYMSVGLPDEAKKNAAVLGYNFPESEWYKDSYDLLNGDRAAPQLQDNWVDAAAAYLNPF